MRARWSRRRAAACATRSRSRSATAGASRSTAPTAATIAFDLERLPDEPWSDFVGGLCATFGIGLVHLHNISACRDGLLTALAALDLPFGYTVHDLNVACPTITFLAADGMYCGAQTDPATCTRCLAAQPAFAGVDIVALARVAPPAGRARGVPHRAVALGGATRSRRYYPAAARRR